GGTRLAGPGLDGPAGVGEHDADLVGADVVVLVQVEDHLGGNGQHVGSFQTGRGHVAPGFPGAASLVGSEAGDGGVDAVDDGLVQLVPGHGPRGVPSPLDVDLAVGGVEVHLGDGTEDAAGLGVGDGLPAQRGVVDVAGLVTLDLQADEPGPVVEVDPVVAVLGPPVAADGNEGLDGEGGHSGSAPFGRGSITPPLCLGTQALSRGVQKNPRIFLCSPARSLPTA